MTASSYNLLVRVIPGATLFTVILNLATSLLSDFAKPVTPARKEFDKIRLSTGCFTEIEVRLIVDFSGHRVNINQTITIEANNTASAYSILLLANLTVKVKTFPNGLFIEAIEGIEQTPENYWKYYIDGEAGGIASDKLDLREYNAKEVKWIYTSHS